MFDHKCVFKIKNAPGIDIEELELELIDYGADEVFIDEVENKDGDTEEQINIYGEYTAFNNIQKYIEEKGYDMISAGFDRFPNGEMKALSGTDREDVDKLLEKLEEDDDVQNVYHNME